MTPRFHTSSFNKINTSNTTKLRAYLTLPDRTCFIQTRKYGRESQFQSNSIQIDLYFVYYIPNPKHHNQSEGLLTSKPYNL